MSNITDKLTSLQVERHFLSSLVKYPEILYDVDSYLKSEDFANNLHSVIFSIARQEILAGNTFDKVILAQKLKSLNITTKDDINPFDYISNLYDSQINQKGGINAAKELVKLRIRRDIFQDANEVQNFIVGPKCSEKTISEIVSEVDSIYNKRINSIHSDDEPIDLWAGIEDQFTNIAQNQGNIYTGLISPFTQYNNFFGRLQKGDGAYLFAGRMQEGKSVWLFNMARGISILNNCKILYLDSEMSVFLNRQRALAAESGVNPVFLREGTWANNSLLADKVTKAFKEIKKYNGLYFHKYVPNKDIKEILAIARKWFYKHVGRGGKAMIIMDYLKITMDADKNRNEFQQFGDKISYLNELGSSLDVTMAVGAQQNRGARNGNERVDDDTTIGGSDRINQFARFGAIFRRKSIEEIADCPNFGTHILKPIKWSRDQGEQDYNKHQYIKIPDGNKNKFLQNYLNYEINFYDIKERGTLKDIIDHKNFTKELATDANTDDTDI